LCSFKIQILVSLIILQGIAFELVSLLVVMFFVLESSIDVYEEVIKPLLEKVKPHVELGLTTRPLLNLPPNKRVQVNLDSE
jgi:hypothetical protein